MARSNAIDPNRIDEVLALVGLSDVAGKRVGSFSLGMRQRLGIAAALLGDPPNLILDEPINGLDPDGIQWLRQFLRSLADEGRTVFLSSHLMNEMALTADHVLVIGAGKLLADAAIHDFVQGQNAAEVTVKASAREDELVRLITNNGGSASDEGDHLVVTGLSSSRIGELAAVQSIPLSELTTHEASLEQIFLDLTHATTRHRSSTNGLTMTGASR